MELFQDLCDQHGVRYKDKNPNYILGGTCYKMMKIEQKMENLHAEYNLLENKRKNEKNRAKRFFSLIKAHENKIKCSRELFNKKLKDYPNGKIPK